MGDILEEDDQTVFKETDSLVRRQELLATNRWNQDEYYKTVADGYPWATLTHDTARDVYTFELPYGVSSLSIQPIPNKNLDLINKTSERLLVDFPEADAQPMDDSEEAEQAAEMADRFLAEDSGEQGTNDAVLFDDRVKLSLMTASSYIEGWTDPTGGGYVPLQIEAHPQAVSPDNPLVGPDGMPTTDNVLRYVTAPQGGQFTDDPSQAAPQWQPKVRATKWAREHIRTFPEDQPVETADEVVILGYCTLSQGKKRWPTLAQSAPEDLSAFCDWQPAQYLRLLPKFQQARWKIGDAKNKNKGGSSDERIMFYYHRFIKPRPDYPKGADVVMSGIDGGTIIDRKLLAVEVEVTKGQGQPVKETRCREIPVVQITPRGDPTGQDPSGKCFMNLFVGATEANSVLSQGYAEGLDKVLHTPFASTSMTAIEGWQVENARRSGDILKVLMKEDLPQQLQPPVLPGGFFEMYNLSDEAINSIATNERAASGADNSKERSGKALQIAVSQNSIGNSSMLNAVNNAYARWCRIKIEIAMSDYTTPQQVSYVGEDGANKQKDLARMDLALIGKITIKTGTGTGLSQDNKVQYLGNLKAEEFITLDEAKDAARQSFAKRLGLPANPFEQYVSRCLDSWLEGPPEDDPTPDPMTGMPKPGWQQQYATWKQAQDQFQAAQQQFQQQTQARQQYLTLEAQAQAGPASPTLGPEQQNEKANVDYQNAVIQMQVMQQTDPTVLQQPVPPQPPQVPKPWVPFEPRPIDNMPEVSAVWVRKLSRTIATVEFGNFIPEWQDVLTRQFTLVRQAAATASAALPQPNQQKPKGSTPQTQPTPPSQPSQTAPNLPAGAR